MRRCLLLCAIVVLSCTSMFAALTYTRVVVSPSSPDHSSIKSIGDLDGDGKPDLIVAGANGPILWYKNPTWVQGTITTGGASDAGSATGDIDGDGDIDVVVGRDWYENVNNGASWITHHLSDEVQSHDICIADMNGDGKKDIIYRGEEFDPVTIFLQGATPATWTFFEIPIGLGGNNHNGLDVADIDNDGKLDFAIHGVWGKNPGGNIATTPWPEYTFATWNPLSSVTIFDMDGDGRKDIVLSVSQSTGNLSWFKAPADPTTNAWVEKPIATGLVGVHAFVVSDVDNDGLPDVTISESDETGRLIIYFNRSTSWQPVVLGNDQLHNIRGADLNGDGHTDFFGVHSAASGTNPVLVFLSVASPPSAPTLTSPSNGSTNQPLTVTLLWHSVSDATNYHVQLGTDSLFTSLVVNDSTITDTTRQIGALLSSTQYYWRVRAKNSGGSSSFTQPWTFATQASPPASPALMLPPNGSISQPLTLTLLWHSAPGASSYHAQLATDSLFSSLVINDSTLVDSSRQVSSLLPYTKYYWRVRARNSNGYSTFTQSWSFQTQAPAPGAPTLMSPANGSTNQPTNLGFVWRSSVSATSYLLQASSDSLFTFLLFNDSTLTDTARVAVLPGGTTIFWRVRAKNTGGASPFSTVWRLTTAAQVSRHYGVAGGWNVVSIPLGVSDYRKTTLFPTAVSSAFGFVQGGGYATEDTLANGTGYWLKFAVADSVIMTGAPLNTDTIAVSTGWNFIGPFSNLVDVGSILQVPPGTVLSSFFEYSAGYASSATLQPGKGYWVKCGGVGYLVLTSVMRPDGTR